MDLHFTVVILHTGSSKNKKKDPSFFLRGTLGSPERVTRDRATRERERERDQKSPTSVAHLDHATNRHNQRIVIDCEAPDCRHRNTYIHTYVPGTIRTDNDDNNSNGGKSHDTGRGLDNKQFDWC